MAQNGLPKAFSAKTTIYRVVWYTLHNHLCLRISRASVIKLSRHAITTFFYKNRYQKLACI